MKNVFAEARIVFELRQADGAIPVIDILHKEGDSKLTLYLFEDCGSGAPAPETAAIDLPDHIGLSFIVFVVLVSSRSLS